MKGNKKEKSMEGTGIFANTFLAEVAEVLALKQFDSLNQLDVIQEGEKVVAEMTDLEKAIFSLSTIKANKIQKKSEKICLTCDHSPKQMASPKCAELHKLKDQSEVLTKIGWQIIEDRLNLHAAKLGLCKGFKIVSAPEHSVII